MAGFQLSVLFFCTLACLLMVLGRLEAKTKPLYHVFVLHLPFVCGSGALAVMPGRDCSCSLMMLWCVLSSAQFVCVWLACA